MIISNFLHQFVGLEELPVPLERVARSVLDCSPIDAIEIYAHPGDETIVRGVFVRYRKSVGVYKEAEDIAEIVYVTQLPLEWQRLVVAKEMMHCFDEAPERTNSNVDIERLVEGIANIRVQLDTSSQFAAEFKALRLALLVLFPEKAREELLPKYQAGKLSDGIIAQMAQIPEPYVPWIMSKHYDDELSALHKVELVEVTSS